MLRERVDEVLSTLSPREARILRLRFGLDDNHPYTLEEVGAKFGLTRERIRQIEGKALRRLRHPFRARGGYTSTCESQGNLPRLQSTNTRMRDPEHPRRDRQNHSRISHEYTNSPRTAPIRAS